MRRTAGVPPAAPESALARLLEVETRLEAMLDETRTLADATLQQARDRAEARLGTLASELAAAESAVAATLASEAAAQVLRERAALAQVCARYDAVDDAGIEALAAWVFDQVLGSAGAGVT